MASPNCCPTVLDGFCLADGTPITIHFQNGAQTGWTNLITGVFTPGPPPVGTTLCATGGGGPGANLDCSTDSVTICVEDTIPVSGTVSVDGTVGVTGVVSIDGPVEVTGSVSIDGEVNTRPLDCLTDSVTICVDEAIPVSGRDLDCATDSVTVCPGPDPLTVVANNLDIRDLSCAIDSVVVCPGEVPLNVVVDDFPAITGFSTEVNTSQMECLLEHVIMELRIMNIHLSQLSDLSVDNRHVSDTG